MMRVPPPLQNISAEKAVLGSLMCSKLDYWAVCEELSANSFTVPLHTKIYQEIQDIHVRGRQFSLTLLKSNLPERWEDGTAIAAYLALLMAEADGLNARDFTDQLGDLASRRRLIAASEFILRTVNLLDRAAVDIASDVESQINEVLHQASPMRPKSIGEIAGLVSRHANSAHMGEVVSGLNTGISPLDEILGLMLGADLGAVIASQGDGKSALAAQIGIHAAASGRPVMFVQLEMSDEQMAARELAALSGVSVNQIHEGAFDAFQWEEISLAEKQLRKMPFHIIDAEEMTVRQIKAQALGMQRTIGLSLVIIDQLDKVKAEGKPRDRFERMAEITRDLKKLAKFLKVPVIVLAQRTRGAQRRDDPTPDVLDADAPSLERDCDWIIGLWQRKNWLRRNKPDGRSEAETTKWEADMFRCKDQAEVICLKRRRGKAFDQKTLRFHGPTMRFHEA